MGERIEIDPALQALVAGVYVRATRRLGMTENQVAQAFLDSIVESFVQTFGAQATADAFRTLADNIEAGVFGPAAISNDNPT